MKKCQKIDNVFIVKLNFLMFHDYCDQIAFLWLSLMKGIGAKDIN